MKCSNCGGTGVIHFRNIHALCGKCQGIGFIDDDEPKPKKQMTEQEWLQTATTEQLAEFLSNLPMRPCIVCPKWETYCRSHSGSPCWEDGNEYDLWKEWLNQPHTKEETK